MMSSTLRWQYRSRLFLHRAVVLSSISCSNSRLGLLLLYVPYPQVPLASWARTTCLVLVILYDNEYKASPAVSY